jgi:uncharacterized protein YxjI
MLNAKRGKKNLSQIEASLIASKLGILFTIKNNEYMSFKADFVNLNDTQLLTLENILRQEFNVKMGSEIHTIAIKKKYSSQQQLTSLSQRKQGSFFSKIKAFLNH